MAHQDRAQVHVFERFASAATRFTGSVRAFALALGIILVWGITGPAVPLLGHLAARDQHRNHDRHLPPNKS